MSSYHITAREKKTGKLYRVFARDNYFGRYEYGYQIEDTGQVFKQKEFYKRFEEVEE